MENDYKETRVWGGPGRNKTGYLAKQVRIATGKLGYDAVLATSFTVAAATALAGRGLPIPKENVGTLHSLCYHALGRPEIAEKHRELWNKEHPGLRISLRPDDLEDLLEPESIRSSPGDELYDHMILRARRVPRDEWPAAVRGFADLQDGWKQDCRIMDFTDLLEGALRDIKTHPANPQVVVCDEAQDCNRLQLALLRQWGRQAGHLLLGADDDQAIYEWAGADPLALTEGGNESSAWFSHSPTACRA